VVTAILDLLDAKHGQEIVGGKRAPLTINRGKIHDYLCMTLDYSEPGYVKLDMRACVKKILAEMPEDMEGTATSPAADYLFKIVEGCKAQSCVPVNHGFAVCPGITACPNGQ
jgi:hypothetical protein